MKAAGGRAVFDSAFRIPQSAFSRFVAAPVLLYFVSFVLLTFPLIAQFNTAYFTDRNDGYQMIWDLWWVRHAIVDLHQNPFFTHELYFPVGSSLLLHSLGLFDGLINIPLTLVLTQIQAFNVLVIVAFVGSGLTAFWLCWFVTRCYWASLAGGFAFAFCSYRWAHYHGHLPLISTQWMPLYVLGLLSMIARPRMATAIATAITLLVILLIDQYQFFYCVLTSVSVFLWWGTRLATDAADRPSSVRAHAITLGTFLAVVAITSGPIVLAMMHESRTPQLSTHDPDLFSIDLLAPWVPDWAWIYNGLTRRLWLTLETAPEAEKAVCVGPAVIVAAAFAFFPRNRRPRFAIGSPLLFLLVAITFVALSFGPIWRFDTIAITGLTPYRALLAIFPPMRFAGSVSRMMIMAQLALSVLAAAGLSRLAHLKPGPWRKAIVILIVAAMVIESQPRVLITCPPDVPQWVNVLRVDPGRGAVLDLPEVNRPIDMYYQTIHHHPIAGGDLSRVSANVMNAGMVPIDDVPQGKFDQLAHIGFEYVVTSASDAALPLPLLYSDRAARLYSIPLASRR
jgi:hypothetical protein